MKTAQARSISLPLLLVLLMASCSRQGAGTKLPLIALSILPQVYFAEYIASGHVKITLLAGPGQNPHTFEPSPRQLADLAEARFWILSGAEFEINLRPKIASLFKNLSIVDGTAGVQFRSLEPDYRDEDDDSGLDRHTWLGQEAAKIMAKHIQDALIAMDSVSAADAAEFRRKYQALVSEIDETFDALRHSLAPLRGKAVFVYHPAFGYFLDEFGMTQEAVETGGKEPSPRELNALIEKAKRERPAALFVQAQFPLQAARTVADAVGAAVIALDPLAPDWLANIRVMGEALKAAVKE